MTPELDLGRFRHLAIHGYWFCRTCQRVTAPADENAAYLECTRCGSRSIAWQPGIGNPPTNVRDFRPEPPTYDI